MKKLLCATLVLMAEPVMAAHYNHFYENPTFWVAVSFVLVILLIIKPVARAVNTMLEGKVKSVLTSIQNASALRNDAQRLLEEYQTKQKNVKKEVDVLLNDAKQQVKQLKDDAFFRIDEDFFIKEKELSSKLGVMQMQAQAEIVKLVSDKTIDIVKEALLKKQDKKTQESLVKKAIENL